MHPKPFRDAEATDWTANALPLFHPSVRNVSRQAAGKVAVDVGAHASFVGPTPCPGRVPTDVPTKTPRHKTEHSASESCPHSRGHPPAARAWRRAPLAPIIVRTWPWMASLAYAAATGRPSRPPRSAPRDGTPGETLLLEQASAAFLEYDLRGAPQAQAEARLDFQTRGIPAPVEAFSQQSAISSPQPGPDLSVLGSGACVAVGPALQRDVQKHRQPAQQLACARRRGHSNRTTVGPHPDFNRFTA